MDTQNHKSYLTIKAIWRDEHMFEIRIQATNGRYLGTTEVYETSDKLAEFARSLSAYPKDKSSLSYEAGEMDGYAYFGMKLTSINHSGHISVLINLEENVSTEYRADEKDKLKLEILVEPNAIDIFQKELLQLAIKQEGTAILHGMNNI
jgi:hypothetical protein